MAKLSAFLNVRDIQTSLDWYTGLGFQELERVEDEDGLHYVDLELDGCVIGLGAIDSNDDPGFQAWVSGELGRGVIFYVELPTDEEVDQAFEQAQSIGAKVEFEPTDRPYGRLFMLNDPDGYSISFLSPPEQ